MDKNATSAALKSGEIVLSRLSELARTDREVHRALTVLHRWLGRALREAPSDSGTSENIVTVSGERRTVNVQRAEDSRRERDFRPIDLSLVVRRAQAKARACRVATEPEDHPERVEAARELAQYDGVWAWMLDLDRRNADRGSLDLVGATFDNVALAAKTALDLSEHGLLDGAPPPELLYLLAEAQSALLGALDAVDIRTDGDQRDLFMWLKDQTTRHRIYVDRHMRLDDPADFRAHEGLTERLSHLEADLETRKRTDHERRRLADKMRFHCHKAVADAEFGGYDVDAMVEAARLWLAAGLPDRDLALRKALQPLLERSEPLTLDEPLRRLVDANTARPAIHRSGEGSDSEVDSPARTSLITRARSLLSGRHALLFGRAERPLSKAALERELGLARVTWIELEEDAGLAPIEGEVARADVNLILIAMRLPNEAYEQFKQLCIEHGKPFVRLPNGYGPGQVAQQVLRQVGRRLTPVEGLSESADLPELGSRASS